MQPHLCRGFRWLWEGEGSEERVAWQKESGEEKLNRVILLYVGEGRAEYRLLLRQFVSRATWSDHGKVSEGGSGNERSKESYTASSWPDCFLKITKPFLVIF